jgi:hypothetical protein
MEVPFRIHGMRQYLQDMLLLADRTSSGIRHVVTNEGRRLASMTPISFLM